MCWRGSKVSCVHDSQQKTLLVLLRKQVRTVRDFLVPCSFPKNIRPLCHRPIPWWPRWTDLVLRRSDDRLWPSWHKLWIAGCKSVTFIMFHMVKILNLIVLASTYMLPARVVSTQLKNCWTSTSHTLGFVPYSRQYGWPHLVEAPRFGFAWSHEWHHRQCHTQIATEADFGIWMDFGMTKDSILSSVACIVSQPFT